MKKYIDSDPYHWPFDGTFTKENTALIVIDMQIDFCGTGGYIDQMGFDIAQTQSTIAPIKSILEAMRKKRFCIIHTREGHRADLSDLPENKKWRSERNGAGIGSMGPCGRVLTRGEKGWDIIPELYPLPGEPIIDKPGKGAFYATDLDMILKLRGIRNLVITGITTDVCVSTTFRDANDRGYECLLLEDCCAATERKNHLAAVENIKLQGGIFGAVTNSRNFIQKITQFF